MSSYDDPSDVIIDSISAERSYLLAASGSTTLSFRDVSPRTGRWTDEETDFMDFLVHAFDAGTLPLAAGGTKKMKNARLGTRVHELKNITDTNIETAS